MKASFSGLDGTGFEADPQVSPLPTSYLDDRRPKGGASYVRSRASMRRSGAFSQSNAAASVSRRIARSLLGREVGIRLKSGEAVHGIVTDVSFYGEESRVVVGASEYPLSQILTVSPPDLTRESI